MNPNRCCFVVAGKEKSLLLAILIFLTGITPAYAQTPSGATQSAIQGTVVRGKLTEAGHQPLQLYGFSALGIRPLDSTFSTYYGEFELRVPSDYKGVVLLVQNQQFAQTVFALDSAVVLEGPSLERETQVRAVKGAHQQAWAAYIKVREALDVADARWNDLDRHYREHPELPGAAAHGKSANRERLKLLKEQEKAATLYRGLPYLEWYVPTRDAVLGTKPLAPGSIDAERRYADLAALNTADARWETSGLLRDRIDAPFTIAPPLQLSETQSNARTPPPFDAWIPGLSAQPKLFETAINYCFEQHLESKGRTELMEHLATLSLQTNCSITASTQRRLDALRRFKPGTPMPNLPLEGTVLLNDPDRRGAVPNRLSDLGGSTTLVVFAASWCSHCRMEIPQMAERMPLWRAKGLATVLISLDENEAEFRTLANQLPATAVCDFKKWEGTAANLLSVYATPSYFLINADGTLHSRHANLQTLEQAVAQLR